MLAFAMHQCRLQSIYMDICDVFIYITLYTLTILSYLIYIPGTYMYR